MSMAGRNAAHQSYIAMSAMPPGVLGRTVPNVILVTVNDLIEVADFTGDAGQCPYLQEP